MTTTVTIVWENGTEQAPAGTVDGTMFRATVGGVSQDFTASPAIMTTEVSGLTAWSVQRLDASGNPIGTAATGEVTIAPPSVTITIPVNATATVS